MSEFPPPEIEAAEYDNEEDERLVGKMFSAETSAEMESLKEKLARWIRILEQYENAKAPTFSSYANVLGTLLDKTADDQDPHVTELRKLAEGRGRELKSALRRYIENVAKFQHEKMKLARADEVDREKFIEVDRRRKQSHDALIDTLRTTARIIAELQKTVHEETGEEGVKLRGYPSGSGALDGELVFDASFFDNRDGIRDWAIAAWAVEQTRKVKERAAS